MSQTGETLPCIRCDKELEDVMSHGNQPSGGTEFTSYGHYGSNFDPMDGSAIAINLCDDCLRSQAAAILHYPRSQREQRPASQPVRYSETLAMRR